jgi:hypothetical protein
MAWVRYDDSFYGNPKVTQVVVEDPGALALHLLANTWTNAQRKHRGFVPAHQAAALLCDRELAARWAPVLVRSGLWHDWDKMCSACAEEYADLPSDLVGYVFHNAEEYRAPGRDRLVGGTPADLSEKRRAAGRKGGRISAERRKAGEAKQEQANGAPQASASSAPANGPAKTKQSVPRARAGSHDATLFGNEATPPPAETDAGVDASKPSKLLLAGVSPVPVPVTTSASNEAEAGDGKPTPQQRAFGIARDWIAYRAKRNTPVVCKGKTDPIHVLRNLIQPFAEQHYADIEIKQALIRIGESIPSTGKLDRTLADMRSNPSALNQQGRRDGRMGTAAATPSYRLVDSHANADAYHQSI